MYRFYYSPGACSMAVHVALEETGAPYEMEHISTSGAAGVTATTSPEWKAVNPKGRVPALLGVPGRSGGADTLLTEVHAILFYLARAYPDAGLLPTDIAGEARCIEWMNWMASNVHACSFASMWRPYRFVDDERCYPALKQKGQNSLREQFAYMESLMGDGRDWAVPGGYTVVDPYHLVFYLWGKRLGLPMESDYPAWTGIVRKVLARPAVRRALNQEGLLVS